MFDAGWHQGVIGIVASRLKDRFHRPVIAFARGSDGEIKGSGRSIAGLHLRDALDLVAKRHPGLILKFGGHAAAAGVTLRERDFDVFREAFETTVRGLVSRRRSRAPDRNRRLARSAPTHAGRRGAARSRSVWGQGFPEPRSSIAFAVVEQRVVGGRHVKLKLARRGASLRRRCSSVTAAPLPPRIEAPVPARRERIQRHARRLQLDHSSIGRSAARLNPQLQV